MDRITDKIYLGTIHCGNDPVLLKSNGITAVLNVASNLDEVKQNRDPSIEYYHMPLHDGPGNTQEDFDKTVNKLRELVDNGHTVLVHCHVGVSRSPTIVITYLSKVTGQKFYYVEKFVQKARWVIYPNKELVKLGMNYLGEGLPYAV